MTFCIADQRLDADHLASCCNTSWLEQLSPTSVRGDSRIVCTNCKTVMVRCATTNIWYWVGNPKVKTEREPRTEVSDPDPEC